MRKLALMLVQCLLLAGCTGLPQPREMGEMALLRTLGVDGRAPAVTLTASTGERASGTEEGKEESLVLTGEGASLSGAALGLRSQSDSYIFYGYVDKLLLGAQTDIPAALGWFAQDDELGLGAKVWLLRDTAARQGVESGGPGGIEKRLSALALDGKLGSAPMTRTAGEVYIALLERGCAFLPALTGGESLSPAGYAVVQGGAVLGYLEGKQARGLELLAEQPPAEILEVELEGERFSIQITGAQLDCRPRFEGEALQSLALTSRVNAQLRQWDRPPDAARREELSARVGEQLQERMELTLERLQGWGAECVGLGSRVSMAAPWRWGALEEDWQGVFSALSYTLDVEVSLD